MFALNPDNNETRNLYLFSEIDFESVQPIVEQIQLINEIDTGITPEDRKPISLYINSEGGSVAAALSLVNTIEMSTTPVHTHSYGFTCSAALLIFVVGHERYAYKHSLFMFHAVSSALVGSLKDLQDQQALTEKLQERVNEIFSYYTDMSEDLIKELIESRRDHWYDFYQAYDMKLTDYIDIPAVYEKDCERIKKEYPQTESLEVDIEELLLNVPPEEIKALLDKHKGKK